MRIKVLLLSFLLIGGFTTGYPQDRHINLDSLARKMYSEMDCQIYYQIHYQNQFVKATRRMQPYLDSCTFWKLKMDSLDNLMLIRANYLQYKIKSRKY